MKCSDCGEGGYKAGQSIRVHKQQWCRCKRKTRKASVKANSKPKADGLFERIEAEISTFDDKADRLRFALHVMKEFEGSKS